MLASFIILNQRYAVPGSGSRTIEFEHSLDMSFRYENHRDHVKRVPARTKVRIAFFWHVLRTTTVLLVDVLCIRLLPTVTN